jgi:2-oxoglutarate dehydrogenase E2 component (dihydrolipoamide succinyltransferase)
MSFFVKASV